METFIGRLTGDLLSEHGEKISSLCIVLPSRRACLYFKRDLAMRIRKPAWAPAVMTMAEFIDAVTLHSIPDSITLVFELYKAYSGHLPGQEFDSFYPWGSMLLNDFNEIDTHLADAGLLFSNIRDIKEIEQNFGLPEEHAELIKNFWSNFSGNEYGSLKKDFLETWKSLYPVYRDFNRSLAGKNWSTEGSACRRVAEMLKQGHSLSWYKRPAPEGNIIFAGFSALSPSEELIISSLSGQGKASVYYDTDKYYAGDPGHEAGKLFRKKISGGGEFRWMEDFFAGSEKHIEITGVPLKAGQAKALGSRLKELLEEKNIDPEKTAVVLPDQGMLFPVLYSLPEAIKTINVTMGYPLRQTTLYNLFDLLISLHRNRSETGSFYHRDVIRVITHPYFRFTETEKTKQWIERCNSHRWIRISLSMLHSEDAPSYFRELFRDISSAEDAFGYFIRVLEILHLSQKEKEFRYHDIEEEFLFQFYRHLMRLQDILMQSGMTLSLETFWKIFREIAWQTSIPFRGEPMQGLQIMGFLETRALDFQNVFILSMNEGSLPRPSRRHSFIPFALRQAYGLPTFRELDASASYNFYRLLQRAKNIYLYYDTEPGKGSGGDKSRFILQLEQELLKKSHPGTTLSSHIVSTEIPYREDSGISVLKSREVVKKIKKRLSPSALKTYISCSLRFYFRHVAGIREEEEISDEVESRLFGNIFHKAMEHIYAAKGTIDRKRAENIAANEALIEKAVEKGFEIEMNLKPEEIEGKNVLVKKILVSLVKKVLLNDSLDAPFTIISTEQRLSSGIEIPGSGETITVEGYIDRIDQSGDKVRILDYKTGSITFSSRAGIQEIFSNPRHKDLFQAFLYAWIYSKNFPGKSIRAGIYPIKKAGSGVIYLKEGEPLSAADMEEFEEHLRNLLASVFDEKVPFSRTEDAERCTYCEFKGICGR